MSTSQSNLKVDLPPGPYFIAEECAEAALGDLIRGERQAHNEAVQLAIQINQSTGNRTYVLSAAGSRTVQFGRQR